jgi:DNA-binding transcriptional MerR regulator
VSSHLEKILRIKQLSESGISLERIREVLSGGSLALPERSKRPGHIEVRSHLWVTDGIELQVSPETAELSPEELRKFLKLVLEAYEQIKK